MSPSGGGGGVLFSLLLLLGMTYAQEILQAPESTVVFLDQSAVFICETVGGLTGWRINGTLLRNLPPEIGNDLVVLPTSTPEGTRVEELTIPARAEYNETRVQCLVLGFGGSSDESENATLRIQGPPSTVVDLTVTHNSTSITISWEAPWSLDVTGVDHDIWYSVLIQNVTNLTTISCTDCTNITETVYTFTPDHLTPCHVYNFSVTSFNGAGQGESSHTEHQGISFERKNITYIGGGMCRVTFKLVCGDSDMINGVTLYYGSNEKAASSISGGEVVFQLPADQEYIATLGVELAQGRMQNLSTHNFTTFDVQNPQAKLHGDNIRVEGTLIYNSTATGCFLAIQCNITTQITFVALEIDETNRTLSEVIEVPRSNYTVYAHDLEKDGLPNPRPANLHPDSLQPITVNGRGDGPKKKNPSNASISHTGSVVTIECTPEEGSSCLVVYRAYGNSTLNIYNGEFPVNVTVDQSGVNYTFAIFRNTSIDERPFFSEMIMVESVSPPSSTPQPTEPTGNGEGTLSSSAVAGVVAGISAAIILVVIIVFVVVMWRQKKSPRKYCPSAVAPSSGGSSCSSHVSYDSNTILIGHRLAEDGSATQAEEKEGKYAVVVALKSGNRFPHSVDTTAVEYAKLDIRATHKMARFDYADVAPSPGNRPVIHDAKTEFPYVDVKLPNPTTPVTSPSVEKATEKTAGEKAMFQGPPTVEAVMSLLYCVAGRWKMIASGLGFNENLIDEIYTNNGTDEACLQDCVEKWVSRLEPSWERLSLVLRDLGEESLAQQAWNGVSAEEGAEYSECSEKEGSHEVVTGARDDTPSSVTSSDETRGKKTDGSLEGEEEEEEEEMRPFIWTYHTLQEEAPAISGCDEESDNFPTQEEGKEVNTTVHVPTLLPPNITTEGIGACVFEEIYLFSLDNACFCGKTPVFNSLKDTDIVRPAIGEQGAEQYQPHSACPGMQGSTTRATTAKAQERDFVAGGIQVVAQHVTGFNETPGVEGEETTSRAVEKKPFSEDLCASTECTDTVGRLRKAVFPSLHIVVEKKMLVVSYDQLLPDRSETLLLKKDSPDPPQEPTPPQGPVEVAVEETGENSPPLTQPPTLPPSSRMEVGGTAQTKNTLPFLDPPENFKEKVVKWLYTGVALGFHGPGSLFNSALGAHQSGELLELLPWSVT